MKKKQKISAEELDLLMGLIGQINSNTKIESLLHQIMVAAKTIMNAEASSLFLLSDDKKELELTIPTGPITAELSGISFPSSSGISGWAVQYRQALIIEDIQNDPRFRGELTEDSDFVSKNMICVPLINYNNETIGALQAINKLGDDSFVTSDIAIFQALANHAAIAIETTLLQKQRIEKEKLDKELEVARTIQSGFWPKKIPEINNYQISGYSQPAKSVGGDYFDYIETQDPNKWGFTVADVSGKGVPASLLMATMRASLRSHVENRRTVLDSMMMVNKIIYEDSPIDKFITAIYGVLDTEKNTFRYVNAGHNNPLIVNPQEKTVTPLKSGGVMLGIIEPNFLEEDVVEINVGEKLVIFSDGIPEAENKEGEFFSDETFEAWLIENGELGASQMMAKLLDTIYNFTQGADQSDDITIIIIERVSEWEAQPKLFD